MSEHPVDPNRTRSCPGCGQLMLFVAWLPELFWCDRCGALHGDERSQAPMTVMIPAVEEWLNKVSQ